MKRPVRVIYAPHIERPLDRKASKRGNFSVRMQKSSGKIRSTKSTWQRSFSLFTTAMLRIVRKIIPFWTRVKENIGPAKKTEKLNQGTLRSFLPYTLNERNRLK